MLNPQTQNKSAEELNKIIREKDMYIHTLMSKCTKYEQEIKCLKIRSSLLCEACQSRVNEDGLMNQDEEDNGQDNQS